MYEEHGYEAGDIISIVKTLKEDTDGQNLRSDVATRLRQHAMTDVPWMPEYLVNAGKTATMNSPRIGGLAHQITTVRSSYQTRVVVVPGNPDLQNKADDAEKRYAIKREELFTPQVIARKSWEQLIVGYGFYKLICGDPDSKNPHSVIQPDPLSCYFTFGEEMYRTMRPNEIAREFDMYIGEAGKGYYNPRSGQRPVWTGTFWDFERLSDDKAPENWGISGSLPKGKAGVGHKCRFYEYDNGYVTWIVGLNKKEKAADNDYSENAWDYTKGTLLWARENLTGGSSYVLVPGYLTGSVELREKLLPHLWEPMNVQYQIDVINTLRASRSFSIKPQILLERTPELLKAAMQLGFVRPAPDGYESLGADTVIELDGKPHFWVLPPDEDLKELARDKRDELEALISTEMALTNADIIKDAAVRNVQLALGVRAQQQSMMLNLEAIGEREILKMYASSIEHEKGYGADERGMYAKTRMGRVKPGTFLKTKKGDFDFEHDVSVVTASLSEQERQFLVQAALERQASHIDTWPQVLDAAGYQDIAEQVQELAEEDGYIAASQFYGPWLKPLFIRRMNERHGIMIPAEQGELPPGPSGATMQPEPNAFPEPETKQATGESGTA